MTYHPILHQYGTCHIVNIGYHSLWDPPLPSRRLQVSWKSSLGGGKQLASDGQKPSKITEEVGAADSDVYQGGCGCPDLRTYLNGSGSVGHALWVGDVGHYTPHWECFGQIPPKGVPQADWESTSDSMVISPYGGCQFPCSQNCETRNFFA